MLLTRVLRSSRAVLFLSVMAAAPGFAMSRPMSDEELVRSSSVVVDARVQRLTSHWNEAHSLIFTTVELDVSGTLYSRDASSPRSLALEILGGELGGVGLLASEAPEFQPGE